MKTSLVTSVLLLLSPIVSSLAVPRTDLISIEEREALVAAVASDAVDLEKRRGGGGGGKSGGGSSGGSSSGGSSSGSSSGSSGSSSGGSGSSGSSSSGSKGSTGSTSSSSNAGGASRAGPGSSRPYGGGNYYAGGAATPYAAGSRSSSGITPYLFAGGALGLAAVAAWHYPFAYAYPYGAPYYYHTPINHDNQNNTANYTMNVICYCEQYSECGCDDNNNSTFLNELIGDPPQNSSVVTIIQNGTHETAYVNGTLANGTTSADPTISGASILALPWKGAWPVVVLVTGMMYAL
ncbi:conserved glycine-rich protein [Talaromyces marneffei ATCC 18224]|uniref:Conserved glycine-rich protein n=1 Tax=Talaromyces marneffei (strain ATCC 18224 / CBS 334.59 / QM 7333) TaxID=441960 RepID=B6QV31_TALMQ|nr:conserved glycine-rich protein [Talaromyces marneffei ATCC 18224]